LEISTRFGSHLWHPLEIIYPFASIGTFLLFGKECYLSDGKDKARPFSRNMKFKALSLFVAYVALLSLIDMDDISKVLNLHLGLNSNYWLAIEAIYPVGSIIFYLTFGKVCYGRK
jgi:hypothetical protein